MPQTRFASLRARMGSACAVLILAACGGTQSAGAAATEPHFAITEMARFEAPWAMAFLPDGRALVTEKAGTLKLWHASRGSVAVAGGPAVSFAGQGGLGDVVLHPDFARNGLVYLSWAEAEGDVKGAAVGQLMGKHGGKAAFEGAGQGAGTRYGRGEARSVQGLVVGVLGQRGLRPGLCAELCSSFRLLQQQQLLQQRLLQEELLLENAEVPPAEDLPAEVPLAEVPPAQVVLQEPLLQ